jgi:hypothetical protein
VIEERVDYQRAATGYLVWPLALADIVREAGSASSWSRIHARQAVVLGVVATIGYAVLLALPLLIVIADPGITTTGVVVIYAAGILADFLGALFLFGLTLYYSGRASRGELFAIPLVTAVVDRVFPGIR